MALVRHR
eukprot:gene27312-biopygen17819